MAQIAQADAMPAQTSTTVQVCEVLDDWSLLHNGQELQVALLGVGLAIAIAVACTNRVRRVSGRTRHYLGSQRSNRKCYLQQQRGFLYEGFVSVPVLDAGRCLWRSKRNSDSPANAMAADPAKVVISGTSPNRR